MSAVHKAEKMRREGIGDHHAQMLDAQAQCVPCKLCGGQAVVSDAGEGWGYNIACGAYGEHLRKVKCTQGGIRLSGWAYNVSDLWNRLNAAPVSAGKVKALEWGEESKFCGQPAFYADTDFGGWMCVAYTGREGRWAYDDSAGNISEQDWATAAECQAAAQADYEARILAQFQPGDGWQGIESAPKDGATVILWVVTEYAPQGHMLWPCKVIYDDWCWEISDNVHLDWDYQIIEDKITHWMPLPAPPASLPQNNGEG